MFIPLRDHNPASRPPIVTVAFIALNVIVFLVGLAAGDGTERAAWTWGFIPAKFTHGATGLTVDGLVREIAPAWRRPGAPVRLAEREILREAASSLEAARRVPPWLTLLTCMFLHGGWLHLIGNVWFLWIFGNNIEDRCGHFRFIAFYLLTGLAATLAHYVIDRGSHVPVIGASGAISGVLGGYLLLFPRARIDTLVVFYVIHVAEVPAAVFLIVWAGIQIAGSLPSLGQTVGGGVAYLAHIGGFVAGLALVRLFDRGRTWVHERRPDPADIWRRMR